MNVGKIHLREIIKRISPAYSDGNTKKGFGMDLVKFWSRYGNEMGTSSLDKARIFEDKIINNEWYNNLWSGIRTALKNIHKRFVGMIKLRIKIIKNTSVERRCIDRRRHLTEEAGSIHNA
jgi:hypothetical protein